MPNLRPYLHTTTYPSMTPSEVALSIARKVAKQHLIKGVVMDGGMIKRSQLYKLRCHGIPFVAHIPNSHVVKYTKKQVYGTKKEIKAIAGINIKNLANLFPPSKIRWYPKLECYAKKIKVYLPNVGKVWLMIIWWRKGTGVELFVLVFTTEGIGVQEIIRAYKSRWGDEIDQPQYSYKHNFLHSDFWVPVTCINSFLTNFSQAFHYFFDAKPSASFHQ